MPDGGTAPVARIASGASPRSQASAAERSGAPGTVSSNRSVTGGAAGPTLPAASSSATRIAYSPGPGRSPIATAPRAPMVRATGAAHRPARQTVSRARTTGAA